MEDINTKIASQQNELKLYMEVADKPINDKVYCIYILLYIIYIKKIYIY